MVATQTAPTNVPLWEIPIYALYSGYIWVSYPQESLENTINTMGPLLGYTQLSLETDIFLKSKL